MQLKDFSYRLPIELIAKYPAKQRDASRLLVLHRRTGKIEHKKFSDICDCFQAGDVLVVNDSRVFPARLVATRKTGGRQEILLLNPKSEIVRQRTDQHQAENSKQIRISEIQRKKQKTPRSKKPHNSEVWSVLINASQRVKQGAVFEFGGLRVEILSAEGNERNALLEFEGDLLDVLDRIGHIPLPPYIDRPDEPADRERYQTAYASKTGSVAAPTAGLHFTQEIFKRLEQKGVIVVPVTLHVGPGTFLPVHVDQIEDHRMHAESFAITQAACDVIAAAKREGRSVTTVGTTTTRVLESIVRGPQGLSAQTGWTDIFIYPMFEFRVVDRLITNFHLSESTLLMLVSAFADRERVLAAYQEAIHQKYRFFSYGDAMFVC